MKRKVVSFILSLFVAFSLWAQNPTKGFPYYYYNSSERSWSSLGLSSYHEANIRDNKTWTVDLYKKSSMDYIVFRYKGKVSEKSIRNTLERDKSVWKNYDNKNGYPGVCLIFLDAKGNFICSAEYSDNY